MSLAGRAVQITKGNDAAALDSLAAAYAEKQQFENAVLTGRRAQAQAERENRPALRPPSSAESRCTNLNNPTEQANHNPAPKTSFSRRDVRREVGREARSWSTE